MNTLKKSTFATLVLAFAASFLATGCNTMKGLGKDTERAGEKIQEKASR